MEKITEEMVNITERMGNRVDNNCKNSEKMSKRVEKKSKERGFAEKVRRLAGEKSKLAGQERGFVERMRDFAERMRKRVWKKGRNCRGDAMKMPLLWHFDTYLSHFLKNVLHIDEYFIFLRNIIKNTTNHFIYLMHMRKFITSILVMLGVYIPLSVEAQTVYSEDFSSETGFNSFTLINKGSGTKNWFYSSNNMEYWDFKYKEVEVWALTPGIALETGKAYELQFDARNSGSAKHELYVFLKSTNVADEISFDDSYIFHETISTTSASTKTVQIAVPEVGTYYIGFVVKEETSTTNNLCVDNIKVVEIAEAPNAITELAATVGENGEQKATLTWVNPAKTNFGNDLSEISKIEVYRGKSSYSTGLVYTLEDTEYLTPGGNITFVDENVPEVGVHYYDVIVYSGESKSSETSVKTEWIGKDSSLKALGTITASVNEDNHVVLDFAIPEGSNGAYVDPADVTFKIERKLASESNYYFTTIDAAYAGELPYVDSSVEPFNIYTYRVSTVYNGSTGTPKTTSDVTVAGVATVPYKQEFPDSNSFTFFTTFNGTTGLTGKWAYGSYNIRYYNGGYWSDDTEADAWTLTPKIALEAGKVYQLSYDSWLSSVSESNYKDLYVTIGNAPTAEAQTVLNEGNVTVTNGSSDTEALTRNIIFHVDESGEYHIGFHVYGQTSSAYIYLDNISIVEIKEAPVAVTDLTATAAEAGALNATITWTNPTVSNAGNELTAITKAELYRDGEIIYTAEETEVGASETYTDADAALTAGNHTYTVVTYFGENASEESNEATVWVGPDALKAVTNVSATVSEDNTTVTIAFDALDVNTGGANGGYIGEVAYKVVRMPDEKVVAEAAEGSPVSDDITGISLGAYYYAVYVTRGEEESEAANSAKIVLGDAITINNGETYSFDFSTADFFELWSNTTDETFTHKWTYSAINKYLDSSFYDAVVFTPKFHLYEGTYELEYYARSFNGSRAAGLIIFLSTDTASSIDSTTTTESYTAEASTTTLISSKIFQSGLMELNTAEFTVEKAGDYYIGFQHYEASMTSNIYLKDVSITAKNVTGVKSIDAERSGMIYDINGETLITEAGAEIEVYRMDGTRVISTVSDGEVSLSGLGKGIYVVRIGAKAFKIAK